MKQTNILQLVQRERVLQCPTWIEAVVRAKKYDRWVREVHEQERKAEMVGKLKAMAYVIALICGAIMGFIW